MKKNHRLIVALLFSLLLLLPSCKPEATPENDYLTLSLVEGEHWLHAYGIFMNPPQMAFWLESLDGEYLATIYVTEKTATQGWFGGDPSIRRPSSLPVWAHARGVQEADELYLPTKETPLPDAVTGATPRQGFKVSADRPAELSPGRYVLFAEINHSLDYNDTFTEELEPTNPVDPDSKTLGGQPSVIFRAELEIGGEASAAELILVGHGDTSGATGEIFRDIDGLTTALGIVDSIRIAYTP
ncbi:hypothetical protein K8R78_04375 [bacterium]|nr:hypothetical protein [bacterium]